ncbi:MAG: integrase arm-type DNA-binding domain-containing protein [Sphingorhabdus sp.]|uniref:tyrosine-type recombinase/integrase n=1 Tax=Sphingorhabdus sp. TaxID=1902408 RepID=UPI0025FC6A4A|nr:site-specific integrase [Sphingorhabdus sp.]MCO4092968.1 integrase arm-type DNA-binding domain-containing protein [Sphingorhabdus sp.]
MGYLSASFVRSAKKPGRYSDGDGLYLLVGPTGSRSWVCRVQRRGKRRDFGLGSETLISLAEARKRCLEVRTQVEAGLDPIRERIKNQDIPTFRDAAAKVFAENQKTWRNAKHRAQWMTTLTTYAFPAIGDITMDVLDGPDVRDVLVAIWLEKPETARRVRQRIVSVVDWAVAKGYRENGLPMPAINKSLPKAKAKVKHHAALPYDDVPQFISSLHNMDTIGSLALELLILSATRSGEVRGATWAEIDLEKQLWTIPEARMKGGVEHAIPLSAAMIDALERAREFKTVYSDMIFPGRDRRRFLSDMTLTKICRDMKVNAVPHGFRSSFRDWAAEETNFDGMVAEMALAHSIENKVEAAYRRGNLLEKRRLLMEAWGNYCTDRDTNIVQLATATR